MSSRVAFPGFVGSAFRNQSYRLDSQDLWNWFLERADSPGAKARQALMPCPGFERFVTLPSGPTRGLFAQNNRLFAVGGTFLYEISRTGAITFRPMTTLATPSTPIITQNPLPAPLVEPNAPVVTHGGAIGGTTYGYRITATNEWGETIGSVVGTSAYGNAVLSATNWNIVSWTYVQGATGYKVYRTAGPGAGVVVAIVASTTIVINDIGTAGTAGTPPATNTTGGSPGTQTFGYQIVATLGLGQTAASAEGRTNTSFNSLTSTHYNIITWTRVPKALGYKVYRTTATLSVGTDSIAHPPARLIATITDTDPASHDPLTFHDLGGVLGLGIEEAPSGSNSTGGVPMFNDGAPVSFSSSGDAGNELLIVSGGSAYCYDLESDVFAPVLDGATFGGFIDSYFVVLDAGSSTLKVSESLDGFRWDPTQVYQRSRAGDKWLSMAVTSNELWLIGSQTGEVWRGTGDFEQRFIPFTAVFLESGIIAASSLQRIGGTLMWLAQDRDGAGFVVRTNGYTPTPVSTVPVDWSIQNLTTIADAFAFTYQQEGHLFYVLTFPSDDITWVYDFTTGEWHKRGIWDPNAMSYHAYRPQCHAFAFGGVGFGKNLVGDRLTGVVADMDPSYGLDINGTVIRRVRQTPHVSIRDQEATFDRFQVDMDVGQGFTLSKKPLLPYNEQVIADGAIAYWRLGELSGTTAFDEVGHNNATISGAVTLGQPSPVGENNTGMHFAGSTGKIAGGVVPMPTAFSVEAWFRTTYGSRQGIFSTINPSADPSKGVYVANWLGGGFILYSQAAYVVSPGLVNDNQWHHVVATHDGIYGRIYIDGRLVVTGMFPHHAEPVSLQFWIGHNPSTAEYYTGDIDEVAVYPTALTGERIASHYALGVAPVAGPVAVRDAPTMMCCYSNDGGRKWGKELWRSAGNVGETEIQVAWSRLGTSIGKDRVFRLVVSDPAPWRLVGAWLELEGS